MYGSAMIFRCSIPDRGGKAGELVSRARLTIFEDLITVVACADGCSLKIDD